MLDKIGGNKIQNLSFGKNKQQSTSAFKAAKADSIELAGEKLSPMGEQVKKLLVSYQGWVNEPKLKNYNPIEFYKGQIEYLKAEMNPKEFYSAFLEVVEKCQKLKPADIGNFIGEAYTSSKAGNTIMKGYTSTPASRHIEAANKYFAEAITFVSDYAKEIIPADIRRTCLKPILDNPASLINKSFKELAKYSINLLKIFRI